MEKILNLLNNSRIVFESKILDFKQGENFSYIKAKAKLYNETFLHIKIYTSDQEYFYSFHWQDAASNLIIRWDNSPHHYKIDTFPHHKHIGEKIRNSYEITLEKVLNYIEKELNQK